MTNDQTILRGRRIVLPEGIREADVILDKGTIHSIEPFRMRGDITNALIIDADNLLVLPGLVDSHVHLNEPGRTEWEGIESGTRAALAGGVTSLVDMPLNSAPVTTTVAALEAKRAAARTMHRMNADLGFWGGVIPGNVNDLEPLAEAGVLGFKCFMVHSGIDDFPAATERELRAAMPILARLGLPLLAHAEVHIPMRVAGDPRSHKEWSDSRPPHCEVEAVELLMRLCRETGCRVHVVHVAAAECIAVIAKAKAEGLPVTAETCPHYLVFSGEEIPDGATEYKCAPPIRDRANREALWEGLRSGVIEMIVSDHSPCPPGMKARDTGDFFAAWGGIASLELGLRAIWTEAQSRGFGPEDLARWMSAGPAGLIGLGNRKGRLAPGYDADFVLFDSEASSLVDGSALQHRHPLTPYHGRNLAGAVCETWLRGNRVYRRDPEEIATGIGQFLDRQNFRSA